MTLNQTALFQIYCTFNLHGIKKYLQLNLMWHNLQVLRKVAFPCESYSSLTIICLLCLPIPFQHWPLFHDRTVHEKQPPIRGGHQLTECIDSVKNGEQEILPCEKGSEESFKSYQSAKTSAKRWELKEGSWMAIFPQGFVIGQPMVRLLSGFVFSYSSWKYNNS